MKNLTPELKKELFPDNTILEAYRGSITHNMYIPNTDPNSVDDIDLISVYMAPKEYYVGLGFGKKYTKAIDKFVGKYDVVSYEFRKFISLLLKSNPNVIGLLWLKDNHYIKVNHCASVLIDNRDLFISKDMYASYTGYAYGQLKRMSHYSTAGYMGKKRKALVDKYKFDTKNASHCIRLLRMCMETLTTGEVNVPREDAPQLLEIKRGRWSLEQVKAEADRLFKLTDEAYVRSKLPNHPDYDKIEKIVMETMMDYLVS